MLRKLLALCTVSLLVALAQSTALNVVPVPLPDGRIVGGEDADITQYPHQISMRYNGNHRCGGSIIANNIIVSAAHCVYGLSSAANLSIVAGSTTLSEKAQELRVREFIIHNQYRTLNNDYDAAILVLDGEFTFNAQVQPIALAEQRPEHGTEVIVTGWGTTQEGGSIPNTLQQVNVNIVDNTNCRKAYSIMLTSRMSCAGVDGGGKDACQGDSGGPLVYDNQLLGIVSWGTGCARENYPGVYASVPELRGWILAARDAQANVGKIDFL